MAHHARRRNTLLAVVALVLLLLLLLVLTRCPRERRAPNGPGAASPAPTAPASTAISPAPPPATPSREVLTPAALTVPESIPAGSAFSVAWTGPDNRGDFLTIVKPEAPANTTGPYRETREGSSLELTAPIEPGRYEVRYVTAQSRTILGRAAVEVQPVAAALDAPPEVPLGARFSVSWTGPDNAGDYLTIVARDAPDAQYGDYTPTSQGSPASLTAPPEAGDLELRYVSGQGNKVLARRPIRVAPASVTISAPAEAVAGTTIDVAWTGPNNAGDYLTLVPADTPDGQYGNYTPVAAGSPLKLLMPIFSGSAELRYMTGQGARVLGRRPIRIVAAEVSLSAPDQCEPGAAVSITWTGPNNPGDYLTIVAKAAPDGQYGAYTQTTAGSPLTVAAPKEPGDAEVRYMTGQGGKVLARHGIRIK